VIFAEKRSFAKCQTASRTNTTCFFSSFMCLTNCTPSRRHAFLFHLVERKEFYIFWVSRVDCSWTFHPRSFAWLCCRCS
jgi:hypothetical protein